MNASTKTEPSKTPRAIATFAMANELRLGEDPAEILIPYGRWPYGFKEVELPDGSTRKVYVMQSLQREGAEKIAQAIRAGVAAGGKGLPIYFGHPDVPEVASKFPDKRAKGWGRDAEAGADALVIRAISWAESPADGFGWYSPYWFGPPRFADADNAETDIDELQSIGLTNNPNILDFRLANEAGYDGGSAASTHKPKDSKMEFEQIKKELGLPPEATLEQTLAEIAKLKAAQADGATKLEAANAEAAAAKAEDEKNKVALENERKARAGLLLDMAIADKRISPAARPAWEKRLLADPSAGAIALANEKPLKTESEAAKLGADRRATGVSPLALANEIAAKEGIPFADAWAKLKTTRPELFAAQK